MTDACEFVAGTWDPAHDRGGQVGEGFGHGVAEHLEEHLGIISLAARLVFGGNEGDDSDRSGGLIDGAQGPTVQTAPSGHQPGQGVGGVLVEVMPRPVIAPGRARVRVPRGV